jgi:hypothetical protein
MKKFRDASFVSGAIGGAKADGLQHLGQDPGPTGELRRAILEEGFGVGTMFAVARRAIVYRRLTELQGNDLSCHSDPDSSGTRGMGKARKGINCNTTLPIPA